MLVDVPEIYWQQKIQEINLERIFFVHYPLVDYWNSGKGVQDYFNSVIEISVLNSNLNSFKDPMLNQFRS